MEPFKVRLTGSSSGTVGAVKVTAELIHRVGLADCPEPWAWFRGDDLNGYSDGASIPADAEWLDRTGNGRNLTVEDGSNEFLSRNQYVWVADAIDGQPGVRPQVRTSGSVMDLWRANFAAVSMPNGYTHFHVTQQPDTSVVCVVSPSASPMQGQELLWQVDAGYESFLDGGTNPNVRPYLDGHDDALTDSSLWYAAMGAAGRDDIVMAYNGQPWVDGSGFGSKIVGDGTYFDGATFETIIVSIDTANDTLAEWVVFDQVLSPECVALWWQYFASRYPSLGI